MKNVPQIMGNLNMYASILFWEIFRIPLRDLAELAEALLHARFVYIRIEIFQNFFLRASSFNTHLFITAFSFSLTFIV